LFCLSFFDFSSVISSFQKRFALPSRFFAKPLDFSSELCYTIMRAKKHTIESGFIFLEKYSSGDVCERCLWRMKEGERVAAVKIWRSEQRATNFGHRNRIEEATPIR
jgi:hypothetical protein